MKFIWIGVLVALLIGQGLAFRQSRLRVRELEAEKAKLIETAESYSMTNKSCMKTLGVCKTLVDSGKVRLDRVYTRNEFLEEHCIIPKRARRH